jgi:uncharacterized protein YoxC
MKEAHVDGSVISGVVLPIVFALVGAALVWLVIELVMTVRKARTTIDNLEKQVTPVIEDAKKMTEDLKPAIERVDPLVESASLTVDAANLEIMRLDTILADVSDVTNTASNAVTAVDNATKTPMRIVSGATEKLREAFGVKGASDESVALGDAEKPAIGSASGSSEGAQGGTAADTAAPADAEAQAQADASAESQGSDTADADEGGSEGQTYFTYPPEKPASEK